MQGILGQFYSAQQEKNESVSDSGYRLEQIINKTGMHCKDIDILKLTMKKWQ